MEEELKVMAIQYQTTADKLKEMIGVENLTFLEKDLKVKKKFDQSDKYVGGGLSLIHI